MTKAELHELVDSLPYESLEAAAVLLRRARDPVLAKLDAAPFDDEAMERGDVDAIAEARREPGVGWGKVSEELTAG